MIAFLLNPGGKKKRGRKRGRKYSRRAGARKAAASRRRRVAAGKRAYRHRRALLGGTAARKAISALACGPKPYAKLRRLMRSCPAKIRSEVRSHGGIAGIIAARRAPGAIVHNPRRRRKNGGARFSYTSRRKSKNYSSWIPAYSNPYWVPQFAMNPGIIASATRGYSPKVLLSALPVVGGAIGNAMFAGMLSSRLPSFLQSGLPNLAVGAASAGLLGALVGVVSRRLAAPVFFGGMVEVMTRVIRQYLLPTVGKLKSGIGDYLTRANAADARPLGCFAGGCGMGSGPLGPWNPTGHRSPEDYAAEAINTFTPEFVGSATPEDLTPQYMGDYLTVANAREARPLGALGYTMNDAAIEGSATEELNTGDY